MPGTLVAYATAPQAFRPEHVSALNELLADVATGLANARRFADVEARLLLDPATGIANPRGYEVELGREVARAHRTGRPLSVVLVGIGSGSETTTTGGSAQADQVAQLLTRVTRRSDISCRRGEHEFAILLPETRESGANILNARLREEAKRALGATQQTIAVGHVEWMPDESVEELEARAEAALASPSPRKWATRASARAERTLHSRRRTICAPGLPRRSAATFSTHWLTRSWKPAATAGRSRWSCSTSTGWTISSEGVDREAADAMLGNVARRLSDSVGSGSVHRLGSARFALVLSGGTANDAEALLGTLHASDGGDDAGEIALSAGVTEIVERDGAETALGRAEHALWQASQAGRGTIVVAVPGRRSPRFE